MNKKLRMCEYVEGIAYIKKLRKVKLEEDTVEYVIGIPEELVKEYELKDGDNLEIFSCGEGIVIRKAKGRVFISKVVDWAKNVDLQELELEDSACIKVKGKYPRKVEKI